MKSLYYLLPVVLLSVLSLHSPQATRYLSLQVSNDAMSFYRTGVEHHALRQYRDAVEAFKRAAALDPDYAEAFRELGNSYVSSGQHWKAYEAYVQGLRLHGDYGWNSREAEWFDARINLAITYSIIGNRLGVLGIFSPEIRNGPHPGNDLLAYVKSDRAEVHLYLGEAYFGCADTPENQAILLNAATESFKRAIAIRRGYTEAHVFLGRAYAGLNRPEEAIHSYKKAIQIDPKYSDAYYYLGLAYLDIKDGEASRRQYRVLRRLDPKLAKELLQRLRR